MPRTEIPELRIDFKHEGTDYSLRVFDSMTDKIKYDLELYKGEKKMYRVVTVHTPNHNVVKAVARGYVNVYEDTDVTLPHALFCIAEEYIIRESYSKKAEDAKYTELRKIERALNIEAKYDETEL